MFSLKSLAKSTLGELKDSLLEVDSDDDDDDTPIPAKTAAAEPAVSPWPSWPDSGGIAPASVIATDGCIVPPPMPDGSSNDAKSAPYDFSFATDLPTHLPPAIEQHHVSSTPSNEVREGVVPGLAGLGTEAVNTSNVSDLDQKERQRIFNSVQERYDSLLTQYTLLQQRCREMSQREGSDGVLLQQVDAWKAAHTHAQERVEALTLENMDLKERVRALERRGVDPDEKRKILEKLQQREAELKTAGDALRQLNEVIEDGAGDDKARCSGLEMELMESRRALSEARSMHAAAVAEAQEARKLAEAASAGQEEMAVRLRAIERDSQETSTALEALLREKERHMEEQPHLVDRRLVTCMLANYVDHLQLGRRELADAALAQTLQILGGLPDLEARKRARSGGSAKESLGQTFLEFLDQETAEEISAKNPLHATTSASEPALAPVAAAR